MSEMDFDGRPWEPIFAVAISLAVATTMVALRVWTRASVRRRMGESDWAAVVALIPTTACGITIALSTKFGLGRNLLSLKTDNIEAHFKLYWLNLLFYRIGLLVVKMTFLLQYHRFLASPRVRVANIVAIFIVGGWCLAQVILTTLICQPLRGFWDMQVATTCINMKAQEYVKAGGDIATDLVVLMLAIPACKGLGVPKAPKFLMLGVFALGIFTVAISIIKTMYINMDDYNFTGNDIAVWSWSIGQLASALTCACLPTLRPFLAKFFPSLLDETKSDTTVGRAEMGVDNEEYCEHKGWFRPRDAQGAYLPEADGGPVTVVYEKGDSDEVRQPPSDDGPVPSRGPGTRRETNVARQEIGVGWEKYEMSA